MKSKNESELKYGDAVIFRDDKGIIRAGHLVQLSMDATKVSAHVAGKVYNIKDTDCVKAEDALAALEAKK